MIRYETGDLLSSHAEALVNTVNTVGVMGKGIALQFKNRFPNNYKAYLKAYKNNELRVGKLLVCEDSDLLNGRKIIINFPTKTDWRKPSEYEYIEVGLQELAKTIKNNNIKSIAIPPLGAGNGGLDWNKVLPLFNKYLSDIDSDIIIFSPNAVIQEVIRKERVKLTPARAMLLSMLYELVRNGEFVSEFSAEKQAYFLQRFGAEEQFKLEFNPNYYGPYSGKVKHVLYYLNGSYITGYSSKGIKPFENLGVIPDAESDVNLFLNLEQNKTYLDIVNKTKQFLDGFYSDFSLELLSSVDYIRNTKGINDVEGILTEIEQWNSRKSKLFKNRRFVELALSNIQAYFK